LKSNFLTNQKPDQPDNIAALQMSDQQYNFNIATKINKVRISADKSCFKSSDELFETSYLENSFISLDGENNNLSRSRNNLPSVLMSILKQENIDFENDFYWLNKFQQEKHRNVSNSLGNSLLEPHNLKITKISDNSNNNSRKLSSFEILVDK
jgi:hypothetical protein